MTPNPAGKKPSESSVEMRELVLPNDTNTHGTVLGGRVLHLMDIACAMAATRHCRRPVVTAAMDHVDFLSPVPEGHFLILKAAVNFAGKTSMEVEVHVQSECPLTGALRATSSGYFTFVALDEAGQPAPVPPIIAESADEKRRFDEAKARVGERKKRRKARAHHES
ncbi:MAG: acyl-CoA thioesterase [Planctomycetes bacterium]|nr:acyl-CoA thioesterase [Planctomycetota bacterium]